MTTVREKLDRETGRKIFLYKQGVFWTAYEQSALILSRHKPLKISIKFVKTVDQQVISVGFPEINISRLTSTTQPESSLYCRLPGCKTNDTVLAIKIFARRLMKNL